MMRLDLAPPVRVMAALSRRPRDVPRYVAHNLLRRQTTMELGLPWMSYSVIDFLEGWVDASTSVCECGSGGSTLFFGRRAGEVLSLESDSAWAALVGERLDEEGLSKVTLRHVPADFTEPETLEASDFYAALPATASIDIFVIDSVDHFTHRARPILFRRAEELVVPGGIVLVDDSWRYPQLRRATRAKQVRTFRGVGPGSRRPHWTDVFFY